MTSDKRSSRPGPPEDLEAVRNSPEFKAGQAAGALAAIEHPPSDETLEDIARMFDAADRSARQRESSD